MDEKVLFRTESREHYSAAEMKRIEKVIRTFYNYLRDSRRCELLWSDKVGYVLIPINREKGKSAVGPRMIRDAGDLAHAILEEISEEIAADAGKRRLTKKEYPEFERRIREYMIQLPEYQDCIPFRLRAG